MSFVEDLYKTWEQLVEREYIQRQHGRIFAPELEREMLELKKRILRLIETVGINPKRGNNV